MQLTCLVEIPKGSRNKYEYDEERDEPDRLTAIEGWADRAAAEREIEHATTRLKEQAGARA